MFIVPYIWPERLEHIQNLDVVGESSPQGPEREAPGSDPHRRSSLYLENGAPSIVEDVGEAVPPTRQSPPASMTGEAGSPARPASVRSGVCTPSSTHTGEETQTGSLSGFAGSAPVSPSSEAPATRMDNESSNASTTSNPSRHDMRVMDGVLEDLMSLEDLPRTFRWARVHLLSSLEE